MEDKTRLEHDIEEHEIPGLPLWSRIIILLLILVICSLGLYITKLKKDSAGLRDDLLSLKEEYRIERSDLLSRIQRLETGPPPEEPEVNHGDPAAQSP